MSKKSELPPMDHDFTNQQNSSHRIESCTTLSVFFDLLHAILSIDGGRNTDVAKICQQKLRIQLLVGFAIGVVIYKSSQPYVLRENH